MTAIASIVTDLAHARMLKEAGWPQDDCLHFWVKAIGHRVVWSKQLIGAEPNPEKWPEVKEPIAAPTAEEIIQDLARRLNAEPAVVMKEVAEFAGTTNARCPNLASLAAAYWLFLKKEDAFPTEASRSRTCQGSREPHQGRRAREATIYSPSPGRG